ncbi:hypothetical protein [Moorena sp. SIO3I8]|uniref:hypothetical protein n=1 Tax=Moorena sp. SIO3I8 TaxID=2607833 RepID=UPI0013C05716|nr:hypothetical protein [Moorena sp. SIO3I8]NEO07781.1 hypothetical protein [Moorena sp. SIO3I8]NEO45643.1 hypothetical protein [Moorena sp. SIO4A3]
MRYAHATRTAISATRTLLEVPSAIRLKSLIVGWAVPSNALCKLDYLSDALPTLHELLDHSEGRTVGCAPLSVELFTILLNS